MESIIETLRVKDFLKMGTPLCKDLSEIMVIFLAGWLLLHIIMSRRQVNPARRIADGGSIPFVGSVQAKTRSSPLLSIGLVVLVLYILHYFMPTKFITFFRILSFYFSYARNR